MHTVHTCILPNNQVSISVVVVSVGESMDDLMQKSVQTREHFHCEAQICKHGKLSIIYGPNMASLLADRSQSYVPVDT